jgi:hypothetical protein
MRGSVAAVSKLPFPFRFPLIDGDTGVRVEARLGRGADRMPLWLRTCADRPVRLLPEDWPAGLTESVNRRYAAHNGFDKGRVLFVWTAGANGIELPIACCCWHVHRGNWPLCVLDAGWSRSLKDAAGIVLVERALFGALRQLAGDAHLRDTHEPRPSDRIGWRVNHEEGAGSLQARRVWARTVATRAQRDFRFGRLEKNKRPTWARVGFYGERVF